MNGLTRILKADWRRLLPIVIIAMGVLAYANSFSGTFIFDDIHTIRRGNTVWQSWLSNDDSFLSWRPVTDATFALNYAFSHLKAADYHAVNLAIHILAGLLLFGIVRRTLAIQGQTLKTGSVPGWPVPAWLAGIVAAIWVVHPLTTASVTYISQRYESLMGMFYLLTLYCVIRGATSRRGTWWYPAAVLSCVLGMGSKEVMITAPVTVLLYDWLFLSAGSTGTDPEDRVSPRLVFRRLFRKRWGLYAGLAGTWLALALLMNVKLRLNETAFYVWKGSSPLSYAATQFGVICRYLQLAVWPVGLCFDYGWPVAETVSDVFLPGFIVTVLVTATVIAVYKRSGWGFPGVWFFLILAPTSSFVPRPDPIVEHRMYLPLAGVTVFGVFAFNWVLRYVVSRLGWSRRVTWTAGAMAASVVIVLAGLTVSRNRVYHSEESVWRSVTAQRPENLRAHLGLGAALLWQGKHDEAEIYFERVLSHIPEVSESTPRSVITVYAMTHNNLGVLRFREAEYEQAENHFKEAIRVAPEFTEARNNLERALGKLGRTEK